MANRINYFLPYMRQGLTTLADHAQIGGKRMRIPIELNLAAKTQAGGNLEGATVKKNVFLYGPGDILGLNTTAIERLNPTPETRDFEASLTPFIEFKEPDFLWRYSSRYMAAFDAPDRRWIPWLALIILKTEDGQEVGEFEKIQHSNRELPPQIQLKPHAILPDLKESWRWAHIHIQELGTSSPEQIQAIAKRTPQKAVCRLLSPRRLSPQTRYEAFLVPAYRVGLETALGIIGSTDDRRILSWGEAPVEELPANRLPYYHSWKFRTGTKGDFEYLVRKLKPTDLENMGTRPMDCSQPGFGIEPETPEIQLEGALRSLDVEYQAWGMDDKDDQEKTNFPNKTQEALASLLNLREKDGKLRVTPPVYGEWYAEKVGKALSLKPQYHTHWLEELNLDFRHRAAAGLGVQFVKNHQEELMKAAWEQLSKVKKANHQLNLGRYGRQVSLSMYKRLEKISTDRLFRMTLSVQNRVIFENEQTGEESSRSVSSNVQTLGAKLRESPVSSQLGKTKVRKYLPTHRTFKNKKRNNQEEKAAFSPIRREELVSAKFSVGSATEGTTESGIDPSPLFENLGSQTKKALDPKVTIANKFKYRVERIRKWEKKPKQSGSADRTRSVNEVESDELNPIIWHPEFHRPMYRFLRKLSQEYILPGAEGVPPDSVGLLATNRRFIEAFMIGLNHEFAAELRWREFPTDMKGSYFRSFWDTSIYSLDNAEKEAFRKTLIGQRLAQRIKQTYGWAEAGEKLFEKIEATYTMGEPSEVEKEVADAYEAAVEQWLLTRDEDKDINHLTDWQEDTGLGNHPIPERLDDGIEDQSQMVLLVRGELLQKYPNTLIYLVEKSPNDPSKPDLNADHLRKFPIFEGALPPDMVFIGFPIPASEAANYFVVFEERVTDIRFGLDITDKTEPDELKNMSESDFSWQHFPEVGEGNYLDGQSPLIFDTEWEDAAYISKIMLQKQVRVAIELEQITDYIREKKLSVK